MKTCKKSFLVLILAFILCFNSLIFTASADSITGDNYRRSVPAFALGGYALTFACAPLSDNIPRSINRITLDDAYYLDDIYEGSINGHTWYYNGGQIPLYGMASSSQGEEPHNIIDFTMRAQIGYYLYDFPAPDFPNNVNGFVDYPVITFTRSNFYINFTLFERFWSGNYFKFYFDNYSPSTKEIYFFHNISFLDDYGLIKTLLIPAFDGIPGVDDIYINNGSGYDFTGLKLDTEDILDYNPIDAYGNIYIIEHSICGYSSQVLGKPETPYGNYFFRYFQNDLLEVYAGQVNSIYIGNLNNSYYQSASLRFTDNSFSPFGWVGDFMSIEIFPGFPLYYTLLIGFGAIMFGYLIKIFLGG